MIHIIPFSTLKFYFWSWQIFLNIPEWFSSNLSKWNWTSATCLKQVFIRNSKTPVCIQLYSEPAWNCTQSHLIRFTVEEWNIIHQDLIWTDQNSEVSIVRDSIKYEHKHNSDFTILLLYYRRFSTIVFNSFWYV